MYLFYCDTNNLNSFDPNVYAKFFHFFFTNNQININNFKGNNGNQMGIQNGAFNGGNNIGNKVGNEIYVGDMPKIYVNTHHSDCKKLPEIIPRPENYVGNANNNLNNFIANNNTPTVNILFQANTGLKILLPIPRNITIYQMLKMFTDRIPIDENYINNGLTFLFNGQNMLPFFNNLVGDQFKDGMLITVFDQNGVIGA